MNWGQSPVEDPVDIWSANHADQELAEDMGFKVLHGIVDCLWAIGVPISHYKEPVERDRHPDGG